MPALPQVTRPWSGAWLCMEPRARHTVGHCAAGPLLLVAVVLVSWGWPSAASGSGAPHPLGVVSRLSRASALRLGVQDSTQCDLSQGSWVRAPRQSLYSGMTCRHIRSSQNCQRNGRLNTPYLDWRWEPTQSGCVLHRFNPVYFLRRKRNKVIGMTGDSLTANFEDAFRCSLEAAAPTKARYFTFGEIKVPGYHVAAYNVTVLHLPSVFLVQAEAPDGAASDKKWLVHLDRPDTSWSSVLGHLHILIFGTGHWYTNARPWQREYYINGTLKTHMSRQNAMRTALVTLRDRLLSSNFSGIPVLLTFSPFHYHQAYNNASARNCVGAQEPFSPQQQQVAEQHTDALELRSLQVSVFRRGVPGFENRTKVPLRALWQFRILDVTRLSLFRPDAHLQNYTAGAADCSHWCTPGIPDTWVDYLYTLLMH